MLGASLAVTTACGSTSHMSAILFLTDAGMSRSARHTIASGWMPMLRSAATECWVGLVFSSPEGPMYGHQGDVQEEDVVAAHVVAHLARGLDERLALDVTHRAADLGDDHVDVGARLGAHAALDLVRDVRDDLHRVAQVLAAALLGDHLRVHLARGDVGRRPESLTSRKRS